MNDYGQYISSGDGLNKEPRQEDSKPPKGSLEEAMDNLTERLLQADAILSSIADALMEIKERLANRRKDSPGTSDWKEPDPARPKSSDAELFEGERQVEIIWDGEGSAEVVIDNTLKIQLSKVLANLLYVLCEDGDYSPDQKVAWKPVGFLLKRLAPDDSEAITKDSLSTNINRLRDILEQASGHRRHIETSRRLGYRFAKLKSMPKSWGII